MSEVIPSPEPSGQSPERFLEEELPEEANEKIASKLQQSSTGYTQPPASKRLVIPPLNTVSAVVRFLVVLLTLGISISCFLILCFGRTGSVTVLRDVQHFFLNLQTYTFNKDSIMEFYHRISDHVVMELKKDNYHFRFGMMMLILPWMVMAHLKKSLYIKAKDNVLNVRAAAVNVLHHSDGEEFTIEQLHKEVLKHYPIKHHFIVNRLWSKVAGSLDDIIKAGGAIKRKNH
ncbi:hypothetical protein GEMRC1_008022 [Eukaryota sp. GEM-RC1]